MISGSISTSNFSDKDLINGVICTVKLYHTILPIADLKSYIRKIIQFIHYSSFKSKQKQFIIPIWP